MSLRQTIDALCLDRLGREPNLENPTGYNDKIQWLKVHDQRKDHIKACDKWAARQFVPKAHRIPAKLGAFVGRLPCVMKATHDCGSVQIVEKLEDVPSAVGSLNASLKRPYGKEKGEWAYQFIKPRIITETLLERNITDYKFHCVHGRISWVQVIGERKHEEGPRESILDASGQALDLHFDQNMRHAPDAPAYPGDRAWGDLTNLARGLAKAWRYVRVDLYWSRDNAWFGELTFWPLAGCYATDDEPVFGEMLDIDLSRKFDPIVR